MSAPAPRVNTEAATHGTVGRVIGERMVDPGEGRSAVHFRPHSRFVASKNSWRPYYISASVRRRTNGAEELLLSGAVERRMDYSADELRAILAAFQLVAAASWPDLNPTMKARAARWGTASAAELKSELDEYLREVAPPRSNVRIMWKTGPKYLFGGCNEAFARDAGLTVAELVRADDFDK